MRNSTTPLVAGKPQRKLAEIFVESDNDAGFCLSAGEDFMIGAARHVFSYPRYVMPPLAQSGHSVSGEIFVGKNPHSLNVKRVDSLVPQDLTGIVQTSLNILVSQPWIVSQNISLRPALR